jgi:hypothetical protein
MRLPEKYTLTPMAIQACFHAILSAEAPEHLGYKFMENIG